MDLKATVNNEMMWLHVSHGSAKLHAAANTEMKGGSFVH
jgi:hypothetical protein